MPVPGTRPEYTPVKDHYKVFLQTEPTIIDGLPKDHPLFFEELFVPILVIADIQQVVEEPIDLALDPGDLGPGAPWRPGRVDRGVGR